MTSLIPRCHGLIFALGLPLLPAQDWDAAKLAAEAADFQSASPVVRLEQVGKLIAHRDEAFSAIVARIHGDHREYLLKVDRLLDELTDDRWQVREKAERTLIEIGGRARTLIQQRRDDYEYVEQHLRCARILEALKVKGTEAEDRELRLLRGLVVTALHLDSDPHLLRALRSALGHTDPIVVRNAIRALGKLGGDDETKPIAQMLEWKNGMHRSVALAALGRLRSTAALDLCRDLLTGGKLTATETFLVLRALHSRDDDGARELLAELASREDELIAAGASITTESGTPPTPATFTLTDSSKLEAGFGGFFGDSLVMRDGIQGLPAAEIPFQDADIVDFPHQTVPWTGVRVFLTQGSLLIGTLLGIDGEGVHLESPLFGKLSLPREGIQGLAIDPNLDRLVGASIDHDRVRMRNDEFLDGDIIAADANEIRLRQSDGSERQVAVADVSGILFVRPRAVEPDTTTYTRLDLTTGERLIAFVASASGSEIAVVVPNIGKAVLPLAEVTHMELGVGGGALWGFTLIADYSDNTVLEVDDKGKVVFQLEDVFGAWDAECLDNGNLLITEFSVSRVQEIDRSGMTVWSYEDLKNPYDADRLPNGDTLIADTFGSRVVEIDKDGNVVWEYRGDIRPFDADRLLNGNTLIADVVQDRVIEVNKDGEVVWEVKNLPNIHDADRLPNGNTLVTLRNSGTVKELDAEGNVVWELKGLSSPCDADRLPNGNTLVAENTQVREFDRRGNEVWKRETSWAVEVNRY